MTPPAPASTNDAVVTPSLTLLRVVAALGLAISVILIMVGFGWNLWWGAGALFVAPIVPFVLVVVVDAIRR